MNIFDELGNIYTDINSEYAKKEAAARSKGYHKLEAEYFKKRQYNDQSYFLFMFTRLEGRIRQISDNLINTKIASSTNWKVIRVWEILSKQKSNGSLQFMNRVSLLTPKGKADYNLIKQYYDQRNNIGHGGNFTMAISIPTVVVDMKRLYKSL